MLRRCSLGSKNEEHDEEESHGHHRCDNYLFDQAKEVWKCDIGQTQAQTCQLVSDAATNRWSH